MLRRDLLTAGIAAGASGLLTGRTAVAKSGQRAGRTNSRNKSEFGSADINQADGRSAFGFEPFQEPLPVPPTAIPVGYTDPFDDSKGTIEQQFNDLPLDGIDFAGH